TLYTSLEGAAIHAPDADKLHREEFVEIHPSDAAALRLDDEQEVTLATQTGELDIRCKISARVQEGFVFVPSYYDGGAVMRLFERKDELRDVTIRLLAPASDPGWLRMADESVFGVEFELYIGDFARFVTDERRGSYLPNLFSLGMKAYDDERRPDVHVPDVIFCGVSPPNRAGFCHFGVHNWVQRSYAKRCRTVIAEVNPLLQQVFGDVYIHVSEIDHFVEYNAPPFGRAEFD